MQNATYPAEQIQAAQIIWDYMRLGHALKKADAIIVPGSYDVDSAAYAAELFLQGWAPFLVVSGGVKPKSWQNARWAEKTEAEAFAEIAIAAGVLAENVLIENRAKNTSENLWYSEELLQQNGVFLQTALLVQKPSFERRLYATARHHWPDKDIIVTSRPIEITDYFHNVVDFQSGMSSLIGDFQRLETYRGLHLAHEVIPEKCWDAFEMLAQQGYTDRLCESADDTLARLQMIR